MSGPRELPDPTPEEIDAMTNSELRLTASAWHGGQWSPLYAFASSGTVVPGAAAEAEHCLRSAVDATPAERDGLRDLIEYLTEHEPDDDE